MYGPKSGGLIQLRDHNETTVLQKKEKILEKFSDHDESIG